MPDSSASPTGRLAKLLALSGRDVALLLRCLPVVVAARLGLSFLSYQRLRGWIPNRPPAKLADLEELRRVAWGVRNAARVVPRASCLTQALATQYLLARSGQPSQIRIGVAKDSEGRFLAHAWLISDGRVVIGGSASDLRRYASLTDLEIRSP